ncbi:MAG: glycosyltransferase [Spirochaetales bacterium]|nr:glycosyltransferase [Spirochaetales bacterium]
MTISIITVCYNSELTIARTIESVLAQDYPHLEYIIIDGASTDSTMEIVRKYENSFREKGINLITQSEPDKGIYDAMNKGIQKSSGDVIGIINSDDRLAEPNTLSSVAECFERHNCATLYGNIVIVKNNKPYRYWRGGKPRTFRYGWMPPHPSFFVKKEIYTRYGIFRLDCGVNADYELMLRLLEKEKVSTYWLNKTLAYMSAGGTSDSGIKTRIQSIDDNKKAWIINGMDCPPLTVWLKKLRKLPQFITAKFLTQK